VSAMQCRAMLMASVLSFIACDDGWQRVDISLVSRRSSSRLDLQPVYGATRSLASAPPPISGGTLVVASDGHTALAADSDRDRVWIADITKRTLRGDVKLHPGDEPGRIVEGPPGKAFVALRHGGAVAAIDLATSTVTG